mgnify:CR=1 FL=1
MHKSNLVYVPMAADIVHMGHVNIIKTASKFGPVVIGLLTDDAIDSYKRRPIVTWEHRRKVIEAIKGVSFVIPQFTHDYVPNLTTLRPAYVVHGTDWQSGTQQPMRQRVQKTIATWGGTLIEPDYTHDISTSDIINRCMTTLTN